MLERFGIPIQGHARQLCIVVHEHGREGGPLSLRNGDRCGLFGALDTRGDRILCASENLVVSGAELVRDLNNVR
ncbi:hypothetical protein [Burkholderia ambifaria]|uniref:hypothetical protein n=1 Tax=Burkholderia ambifaria TaxID=152480 RepID=UPI00158DC8D6|nr:hypothetical protein [Burkholderia ambifaria]